MAEPSGTIHDKEKYPDTGGWAPIESDAPAENQATTPLSPAELAQRESSPDDQTEGFYKPQTGDKTKETKARFSGRAKAGAAGGIVGAIVGVSSIFNMMINPLQTLHISQLVQGFQFGPVENFGDRLSGRFITYALAGKAARGRLGWHANRRADKWEARLAANGLRSVYSPGTQRGIGYQVTNPARAQSFLNEMRLAGIPADSTFPSGAVDVNGNTIDRGITGVSLEDERSFRRRNRVTRTATKTLGVNKVRAALGSRMLIRRSGTDAMFHPFRNIVRRAADRYGVDLQRRRDREANKKRSGDIDADVSQTRLGRFRQRFGTALRTARGPAAAVVMVCAAKSLNEQIEAQNLESQLTLLRMGVSAVAMGDQMRSFEDFNINELAAANYHYYDPATETSWVQDPGIQYELGQEPTGRDYLEESGAKPGPSTQPEVLRRLGGIRTGAEFLGVRADACDALQAAGDAIGNIPGMGVIEDLTDSAISGLSGRSPDEWQQWMVDRYASDVADIAEGARGALWGGAINTGARLAAVEEQRLSGARELTAAEERGVKQITAIDMREEFASASLFDRYLNILNAQSMLANLYMKAPKTRQQLASSFARIPLITSLAGKVISNFGSNPVAAQRTYDYGFPMYGFSVEEINDTRFENPFEVGNYYDSNPDELDRMNSEYGEDCFGITISHDGSLQYSEVSDTADLTSVPDKCTSGVMGANTNQVLGIQETNLLRYRYHIAYTVTAHTLDCVEGIDDLSCDMLYGRSSTAPPTSGGPSSPGNCPTEPTDQNIVEVEGTRIHSCIAEQFGNMVAAARAAGVDISGGGGWRDPQQQIELRRRNCGSSEYAVYQMPSSQCRPPTARPGSSQHERGLAIDFRNCSVRVTPCYQWLNGNAERFGFFNLPSEPWHWSTTGR